MTSKEFIIKQLNNIISIFPKLKIRYEFENMSNCHYIEILPFEIFGNDKAYIDFENNLSNNFITSFPNETICFLSENSLYEIGNPNFELSGILYGIEYYNLLNFDINLNNLLPNLEKNIVFNLNNASSSNFNNLLNSNFISEKIKIDIDSKNDSFENQNNRFALAA